ncbi:hypothetical protein NECID01_1916 [Nematocida sp. AWRm77]|nr:hypothetical protein NECID01_1916 [Nematocida sp. AWRm77]
MSGWHTQVLVQLSSCAWSTELLSPTLGVLVYAVCAEIQSFTKEERKQIRKLVERVQDCIGQESSVSGQGKSDRLCKNHSTAGCILGLNKLFFLLSQTLSDHTLYFFTPAACEFAISRHVFPEIKEALVHRVVELVLDEKVPEPVLEGVFETLLFLKAHGGVLPQLSRERLSKASSAQVQHLLYLQTRQPRLECLLRRIGVCIEISPSFFGQTVGGMHGQKKSRGEARPGHAPGSELFSSEHPKSIQVQAQVQAEVFLSALKEALERRQFGRLEREKEQDISKTVLFYERLALSELGRPSKLVLDTLQHCMLWRCSEELKQIAVQCVKKKQSTLPLFCAVHLAYSLVENSAEEKASGALLGIVREYLHLPAAGSVILDSLLFYLSHQSEASKKESGCVLAGKVVSWYLEPEKFPEFRALVQKYSWILGAHPIVRGFLDTSVHKEECRAFLAEQLLEHGQIGGVLKHGLEKEAFAQTSLSQQRSDLNPELLSLHAYLEHKQQMHYSPFSAPVQEEACPVPGEKARLEYIERFQKKQIQRCPHLKSLLQEVLDMGITQESIDRVRLLLEQAPDASRVSMFLVLVHFSLLLEIDAASLLWLIKSVEKSMEQSSP